MTQYNTALEKIEDPEDALACKKAELEEKNYDIEEIDEFLKIDEQEVIEKEEDFLIDFENLPRIYKYGLNTLNILNPLTPGEDLHESVLIEKEEASEEEIKRDLEEKNEEKGKSYVRFFNFWVIIRLYNVIG